MLVEIVVVQVDRRLTSSFLTFRPAPQNPQLFGDTYCFASGIAVIGGLLTLRELSMFTVIATRLMMRINLFAMGGGPANVPCGCYKKDAALQANLPWRTHFIAKIKWLLLCN